MSYIWLSKIITPYYISTDMKWEFLCMWGTQGYANFILYFLLDSFNFYLCIHFY